MTVEGGRGHCGHTVPPTPERRLNTGRLHRIRFHESVRTRPQGPKVLRTGERGKPSGTGNGRPPEAGAEGSPSGPGTGAPPEAGTSAPRGWGSGAPEAEERAKPHRGPGSAPPGAEERAPLPGLENG